MYSFPGSEEHLWVGAGGGGVKHVLLQSCETNVNQNIQTFNEVATSTGYRKESTKEIKPLTVRCFNTR